MPPPPNGNVPINLSVGSHDVHVAPSTVHSLLTLNLPFEVRKFEVVFLCLGKECCPFQMTDENSFKSTGQLILYHDFQEAERKMSTDKTFLSQSLFLDIRVAKTIEAYNVNEM